jgi:signal peptidase I
MSKAKPQVAAKRPSPSVSDAPAPPRKDGMRETVESVVIAFVLAFLFRAFEAEAFVIPTGSMAPTLMGVHKDLTCEKCGFPYRVSASEEQDEDAELSRMLMADPQRDPDLRRRAANDLAARDVVGGICPNCRFPMTIDPQTPEGKNFPTYKGDRILVAKFPYDFADPDRWDVVVFKYPQKSNENYIKRCVGLPNETVIIHQGNIYSRTGEDPQRNIARKPPDKVRAIMQSVYDNDYVQPAQIVEGLPVRWHGLAEAGGDSWQPLEGNRAYRTDGTAAGEAWLGYQHLVPTQGDWQQYARGGKFPPTGSIPPRLISDFYAYNAGWHRNLRLGSDAESQGMHWVGDLILDCDLTAEPSGKTPNAEAVLRLVKGGRNFDCRIDVLTGVARMAIDGNDLGASANTVVRPGSRHAISFANVDCQLLLWVDGKVVEFDKPTTYDPIEHDLPTLEDLTPVRIGAVGTALEVDHLRILRDVYYIACQYSLDRPQSASLSDYERPVTGFLSKPTTWPEVFAGLRTVEFPLDSDEFLMLGDNSPRSADSRLWKAPDGTPEHFVNRDLLVGKAVFVYWPHSWNRIPGTGIPFPFFPNFARMKFVR